MATTKRRLTTMEKRAFEACQQIKEWGSAEFAIDWKTSRTWGWCPRIDWHGEKAAYASGCGYDKESACLVEFLQFLVNQDGQYLKGSGCGLRTVQEHLAEFGWTLTKTFSGKREDGYRIERNK